jgi:thiol:disulfide interchange protein DsbA
VCLPYLLPPLYRLWLTPPRFLPVTSRWKRPRQSARAKKSSSLNAWLQKLPKDVQLRRVPVVFRDDWLPAAKLYYALQDVGAEKLHDEVFDAYHLDNLNLDNEQVLMDWVTKKGVDRAKFEASYKSFSTQSKATQGGMLGRAYDIKGVPAFAVDGKYVTAESMTGSRPTLFATLDQLIVKARKDRAGGKIAKVSKVRHAH